MPCAVQHHTPIVQQVQTTHEAPQLQFIVSVRITPAVQVEQRTVAIPQVQVPDVDVPVVVQHQAPTAQTLVPPAPRGAPQIEVTSDKLSWNTPRAVQQLKFYRLRVTMSKS